MEDDGYLRESCFVSADTSLPIVEFNCGQRQSWPFRTMSGWAVASPMCFVSADTKLERAGANARSSRRDQEVLSWRCSLVGESA